MGNPLDQDQAETEVEDHETQETEQTDVVDGPVADEDQEQTETTSGEEELKAQAPEDGEKEEAGPKEDPPWLKKRIGRFSAQNNVLKERLAQKEKEVEELRSKVSASLPMPTPDKYQSDEEYQEALFDWRLAKREKHETRKPDTDQLPDAATKQVERGQAKYKDFAEVVDNPAAKFTASMFDAMKLSDIGEDIFYHLGKHPEESVRIAGLTPVQQVKEIGRLEERILLRVNENKNKINKLPSGPSPRPIQGGKGGQAPGFSTKDLEKMPYDQYCAYMDKKEGRR